MSVRYYSPWVTALLIVGGAATTLLAMFLAGEHFWPVLLALVGGVFLGTGLGRSVLGEEERS